MDKIKKIGKMIFSAAVTTLTSCYVKDVYNKYIHKKVTKN